MIYVISFIYKGGIRLLCDERGTVVAWADLKSLTKSFRKMYVNMASTDSPLMVPLHLAVFQFRYHEVKDHNILERDVVSSEYEVEKCETKSGTCVGLKCSGGAAAEWRKSGKPIEIDVKKTVQKSKKR